MERKILLSSKGLQNLPLTVYENNFEFILIKKIFKCPTFLADFISPKIGKFHQVDITLNQFYINIEDPKNNFNIIMNLMYGKEVQITIEQTYWLLKIGRILENDEIINYVNNFDDQELSINTIFEIIKQKKEFGINISRELQFISSHFSDFEENQLLELEISMIESILKDEELKVENETILFNFLIKFIEINNCECFYLLKYIQCDFLEETDFEKFINLVEKIDNLLFLSWPNIKNKLFNNNLKDLNKLKNRYNKNSKSLLKENNILFSGDLFNGIFQYLSLNHSGNIHDNGIIMIDCQSLYNNSCTYHPKNLFENNNNLFESDNQPRQWVRVDFKEKRINLVGYSLRSCSNGVNGHHFKNWKVCGSNDGLDWTKLDEHQNCSDLNNPYAEKYFQCFSNFDYFKFIKIQFTGTSWDGRNYMKFTRLEFFGNLR